MIVAVFDCVVYLQAAASPKGVAAACLKLVDDGEVHLLLSDFALAEIRDVLQRPAIRKRFPKISDESVAAFLDQLIHQCQMINPPAEGRTHLLRDPKDEPYLSLAIAGAADFVVSRDKDLLSLANTPELAMVAPALAIVDPNAFLNHVRTVIARRLGYE